MTAHILKRAWALLGREEPEPPAAAPRKAPQRYHAVTVVPGRHACAEVRALSGKRFLSREAPPLPLKNCGSAACECRYEHHEDRRKGNRRARDLGVCIDGYDGDEKRHKAKRGRRKTDV